MKAKISRLLAVIALVIALAGAIVPTSAVLAQTTRYVNPDGICGGNTPCYTTITAAVAAANPAGGVTLALEATEHIWARVTVDGLMVFEGQLTPEQAKTWSGQEMVAVETGNGAGLVVTVNGQLQGTMCGRAEVCTRAWGPTGEVVVP